MASHYAIKGQKRKNKREDNYDREKEEEEVQEEGEEHNETVKRAKLEETTQNVEKKSEEEEQDVGAHDMEGIPITLSDQNSKKPGVIFVLEKASLEVAKVGKVCTFELFSIYLFIGYLACGFWFEPFKIGVLNFYFVAFMYAELPDTEF